MQEPDLCARHVQDGSKAYTIYISKAVLLPTKLRERAVSCSDEAQLPAVQANGYTFIMPENALARRLTAACCALCGRIVGSTMGSLKQHEQANTYFWHHGRAWIVHRQGGHHTTEDAVGSSAKRELQDDPLQDDTPHLPWHF